MCVFGVSILSLPNEPSYINALNHNRDFAVTDAVTSVTAEINPVSNRRDAAYIIESDTPLTPAFTPVSILIR